MSAAQPDARPASKLGWKWWLPTILGGSVVLTLIRLSGSVVLLVAYLVALVAVGVVSCRQFVKQEHRRREAEQRCEASGI